MIDSQFIDIRIEVKYDFLKLLVYNVSLIMVVLELIWNGFDVNVQYVKVIFVLNEFNGFYLIWVVDDGDGIDRSRVDFLFGGFGDFWKVKFYCYKGCIFYGKNGKGCFCVFVLGGSVEWWIIYYDGIFVKFYIIMG